MQPSQSVYNNNKEPPDVAGGADRRARKSISNLALSEGLGTTSSRPIDFNPFAPLKNHDQAITLDASDQKNESSHQKFVQKRATKFGSRQNLEELQNENTLSTSGGGTQQPSPNANRSTSLKQDDVMEEKEEQDLKQTGGWGGEQLHQELYLDESEDDLLKNSEEFYENDETHYASKVAPGEAQRRETADFAFKVVKELSEEELRNKVLNEQDDGDTQDVSRDGQRPSWPIRAKPVMLVQPGQLNSRTLGKEQLGQMQIGYSPLVSASQKAVNSVIKIPSYRQQTSEPYHQSVSHNSDTPSRQNSYPMGEAKSFLERMGELKPSTQKSSQQRSNDPMQHTFANLNQPYQPASAQVKPSQQFLTPLCESDMTSEKSAVNPFSIANLNSEAQSEEMVTAEGFFKNPTATAKQLQTVTKSQNRISLPIEQNIQQKSVTSTQTVSRKSEPIGPYANLPAKNQKLVPLQAQKQPISSNMSNNSSSGVLKLKRSQIEVSQVSNDHFPPNELAYMQQDETYKRGLFDQSQALPPNTTFIQESVWVEKFGKTPFDQTLKPAINQDLGIRKYQTQDQTLSSHRHTYSQNNHTDVNNHPNSHEWQQRPFDIQNGVPLFSQQQERRRAGNFDRLVEQTEFQLNQMPKQTESRPLNLSQDKVQGSFRDVFSSGKHYRNASEQKLQSAEIPISGFVLESPQNSGYSGFQQNNLQGNNTFKTAAKLGLLSQENPFGVSNVHNSSNVPFPALFQENSRFSNQGLGQPGSMPYEFTHLQQSDRSQRGMGQVHRFREPPSLPIFPNETNNQSQLMYRKISSQGLMMPQANFKNLEHLGLNSAGRSDLGPYNAPVDHFPGPFAVPQSPQVMLQDQHLGTDTQIYGGSRDRNRNRDGFGLNNPDLNQLQKMNSFTQGSNSNSIPANIRPNVSKNMPLCFRENPSQRQRRGQAVNTASETNNFNNPPISSNSPVKQQDPHNQVRQLSSQKSRSFSNDALNILQSNRLNPIPQSQTRVSDPVSGYQTRVFSGIIPQKEVSHWQ